MVEKPYNVQVFKNSKDAKDKSCTKFIMGNLLDFVVDYTTLDSETGEEIHYHAAIVRLKDLGTVQQVSIDYIRIPE